MGTCAFLKAFVERTAYSFPGLLKYYTNYIVYSNACQKNKQIFTIKKGYFFFLSLPKADKDLVLFNITNSPKMRDQSLF